MERSLSRASHVTVSEFDPPSRTTWTGGMPLGLLKAMRTFTLTSEAQGTTRITMREDFSGPLLPPIGRSIPHLQPSFDRSVDGLKERVGVGERA